MDLSARCGVVTSTSPGCSGVINTTIPNAHRGASGVKPCLGKSNGSSWKIRQDVGDAQGMLDERSPESRLSPGCALAGASQTRERTSISCGGRLRHRALETQIRN